MKTANYTPDIQALEKRWRSDLNEGIALIDAKLDSKCVYVWLCEQHSITYKRGIRAEMKHPCPYCAGKRAIPGLTDIYSLYPFVAEQWDWANNEDDPRTIHPGSKKIYSWICSEGHRREKAPYHELRSPGVCHQCKEAPALLCTLRPELEVLWSPENMGAFTQYPVHSSYRAKWICHQGHSYERMIFHQSNKRERYCPHCRYPLKDQSITVASTPQLIRIWNDHLDPTTVSRQSHLKVSWQCKNGHDFTRMVKEVYELRGTACKECLGPQESYWELSIKEWLEGQSLEFIPNHRILKGREIDVFIASLNKGIEINGEWFHSTAMIVKKYSELFSSAEEYHGEKLRIAEEKDIDLAFIWAHDLSKHYDEVMEQLQNWLKSGDSAHNYSMLNRLNSIFDAPCTLCGVQRSANKNLPGNSLIEW